jgi:VWFA-related protein
MRTPNKSDLILVLLIVLTFGQVVPGQQSTTKPQSTDEVVRISTELVQTGVTVFDKKGVFVDGLKKEDFELRVEGRLTSFPIFENIVAGSQRDRQIRQVRSGKAKESTVDSSQLSFRQRTIIFFLDDRHLSLDSIGRTRSLLLDFIGNKMGQNDLVAIASASGQIGFLQQFTDNKEVLRAAVGRLRHVPYVVSDYGKNAGSPMTEYMALTIERKDDSNVFEFYVQDCLKWAPRGVTKVDRASMRRHCEVEVQNRARQLLTQAGTVTAGTYYSLETLLQSAERMPGSKLAFFISDGFLVETGPRGPVASNQLGRITDEARRAGVVFYTIDARGLISGALDATGNVPIDPNGVLENANVREIAASQDGLNALAADTGGRALRNQNYFNQFVDEALAETSRYYLIAWRPEANDEKSEILKKIEVSVIGRPDLEVRWARAFASNAAAPKKNEASKEEPRISKEDKGPDLDLKNALNDFYPTQALPVHLSLIYLDTPANGTVLTSSVQTPTASLSYGERDDQPANLTIAGVVLNDQGKPVASFKTGLKVNPPTVGQTGDESSVIYNYPSPLKPGIYQVRAAARDDRSGILGSAMQWIVIPDLSKRQITLSSLILGLENVGNKTTGDGRMQWSVDKRVAHNSHLRLMTFIYNGGQAISNNLAAQVQVYKDGQIIVSSPFKKVMPEKDADLQRIPFNADISLSGLASGRYILEVTVKDSVAQKIATQQTAFYIN